VSTVSDVFSIFVCVSMLHRMRQKKFIEKRKIKANLYVHKIRQKSGVRHETTHVVTFNHFLFLKLLTVSCMVSVFFIKVIVMPSCGVHGS
jgi:hypothetical protein